MKYNKYTTFFLQAIGHDLLIYNDFSDSENLNYTNLKSPSVVLFLDFGIIFLPVINSNMPWGNICNYHNCLPFT